MFLGVGADGGDPLNHLFWNHHILEHLKEISQKKLAKFAFLAIL
jgi:hypothetical protein